MAQSIGFDYPILNSNPNSILKPGPVVVQFALIASRKMRKQHYRVASVISAKYIQHVARLFTKMRTCQCAGNECMHCLACAQHEDSLLINRTIKIKNIERIIVINSAMAGPKPYI
ncbi:hypothetical protein BpHYR1_030014 [Brachionus plicatilis]|uniref:Uncharacterized protein n=1 Tax=Brachionus plicatilis TaxID=10195 RepID=A0A3M7QV51_BRAPC|nr:hypothetical protein BpHYR1_030014 [Brachionus plicatilis]